MVRYFAQEPLRSGSRTNYSSLDGGLLVRSTSFPSVNGADQSMSLSTNNLDRGGSRTSLGSRRGDYASTESLHMTPAPPVNALPPTDENAEVQEVSFWDFSEMFLWNFWELGNNLQLKNRIMMWYKFPVNVFTKYVYRKVASRPIFEHFWSVTNWDVLSIAHTLIDF